MSVDDFCRATRRLRNEVPIPANNRVAIGVIRPSAIKIDRLVDPRLLVRTGVRHRRLICCLLYRYERPHISFRSKLLHQFPRLHTIRATEAMSPRVCRPPCYPCNDNSVAQVYERIHIPYSVGRTVKVCRFTPRLPTIRTTEDSTDIACPCDDNSAAEV